MMSIMKETVGNIILFIDNIIIAQDGSYKIKENQSKKLWTLELVTQTAVTLLLYCIITS